MVAGLDESVTKELSAGLDTVENTKASVVRILQQIRRFQERIHKHIEDNYVDFMPNHTTSDMYVCILALKEYLLRFIILKGTLRKENIYCATLNIY